MTVKKRLEYVKKQYGVEVALATAALTAKPHPDRIYFNAFLEGEIGAFEKICNEDPSFRPNWERLIPWVGLQIHRASKMPQWGRHDLWYIWDWWPNVRDWMVSERPNVSGLTFHEAIDQSEEWHSGMEDVLIPVAHDDRGTVLWTEDGWTLQQLLPGNLSGESAAMGHCVDGQAYVNGVLGGWTEIFSLRDPNNQPHVTFEWNVEDMILAQVKGVGNKRPAPEVRPIALRAIHMALLNGVFEGSSVDTDETLCEGLWLLPDAEFINRVLRNRAALSRFKHLHPAFKALDDALRPNAGDRAQAIPCDVSRFGIWEGVLTVHAQWSLNALIARDMGPDLIEFLKRGRPADRLREWSPLVEAMFQSIRAERVHLSADGDWDQVGAAIIKPYAYPLPDTLSDLHKFANKKPWLADLERDGAVLRELWRAQSN